MVCANCGHPIGQVFMTGIGVWVHDPDDWKMLSPQSCRNGNFTRAWPEGRPQWKPTPGRNP
jgi:hypothetical protein